MRPHQIVSTQFCRHWSHHILYSIIITLLLFLDHTRRSQATLIGRPWWRIPVVRSHCLHFCGIFLKEAMAWWLLISFFEGVAWHHDSVTTAMTERSGINQCWGTWRTSRSTSLRGLKLATAKKTCRKSEKPSWYAFEHIHVYMVYMYICIHIRLHIRLHIRICICTCICICICICISICICICICICAVSEFKELYKEFDTARPGKLFASRQSDSFPVTICLANGDPKKSGKWIRWIRYGILLNLFCMFLFQLDSEDSTEMSSFCSRLLAILHGKGGWSWEWARESRERGHLGGKTIGELVMCSLGVFKRTRFGVTDLPHFQCTSYLFHVLSKSCPAIVRTCFSFKRPMGRMDL